MRKKGNGIITHFLQWIGEHKFLSAIIILLLLVFQPFAVHMFLKIPAPSPFFEREWDAGDLITYIAGFEAFIGTVFVGAVAIKQNENLIEAERLRDKPKVGIKAYSFKTVKPTEVGNQPASIYFDEVGKSLKGIEECSKVLMLNLTLMNLAQVCSKITFDCAEISVHDKVVYSFSYVDSDSDSSLNSKYFSPFEEIDIRLLFPSKVIIFSDTTKITIHIVTSNTIGDMYYDKLVFGMNMESDFKLKQT